MSDGPSREEVHDAVDRTVTDLLEAFGWPLSSVLDLGDISASRSVEMYLPLWLRLYGATGTAVVNVRVVTG